MTSRDDDNLEAFVEEPTAKHWSPLLAYKRIRTHGKIMYYSLTRFWEEKKKLENSEDYLEI